MGYLLTSQPLKFNGLPEKRIRTYVPPDSSGEEKIDGGRLWEDKSTKA